MNKIIKFGGLIILFLFISMPVGAQDIESNDQLAREMGEYEWIIKSFDAVIILNEDAGFSVEENILTQFNVTYKHGIFRYIPLKYKKWGIFNYYLKIKEQGIYQSDGTAWDYAQTKSGKFTEYKIGSASKYVELGEQLYKIVYDVNRGIRFFDDHDELYWNITGTDWEVPIMKSSAKIILPKDVDEKELDFVCYTGYFEETEQECSYEYNANTRTVTFTGPSGIEYDNYLTIAVWLPKGYLNEPSAVVKFGYFLRDNYVLFVPIFVFILMFLIWNKKGKDPKSNKPIVAQYDACDYLTPSVVRVIEKEGMFNPHDLPSEIVHLATMRILKIKEIDPDKKKYKIVKRRDWKNNKKITSYQKYLLDQIFTKGGKPQTEVDLDDLKSRFTYSDAQKYKKLGTADIKSKGYYTNPVSSKGLYIGLGMLLLMGSIFWGVTTSSGVNFFMGLISTIIVIAFGVVMPKKSKKGIEMLNYIKGLKEYINVAEKDRIKGEEAANIFSKVLPFAMTMGLIDKWINAFEGILKEPPEWMEVKDPANFTPIYFLSTLNKFETTTNKGFAPAYRSGGSSSSSGFSSGGGFSGGGFGGGGGGSW